MKKTKIVLPLIAIFAIGALASCGGGDSDGKMSLSLRNLYFDTWAGGDAYTDYIQDKFDVSITPTNYSWANWGEQVSSSVQGDNLTDVFHFDLESFNFGNTYEFWAKGKVIKALPDDLSKWPNLKKMIESTSNLDSLKLNGKLYGIPVSYDISNPEKDFSNFTYVYRRDWAKDLGVYKENDEYTWDEFVNVVNKFDTYHDSEDFYAMADVEWGFPSIANFFKDVPHCYIKGADGKYANAFVSDAYIAGLEKSKEFVTKKYYGYDQYSANDGDTYKEFKSGRCGIYYENLSLSNYQTLRKDVKTNQKGVDVDDATAIMKVKGPDGKYALEGTDNWFSMTFFNYDISDEKQAKILDIMDWLLGEEGTRFATYGIEGYDYTVDEETGEISLTEDGWEKDADGNYINKINGARFLRYMATLGNDMKANDPLTDQTARKITTTWSQEMASAKANGQLRVIKESSEVKWLSTPKKNANTSALLSDANDNVVKYTYDKFKTIDEYKNAMATAKWSETLDEINNTLGL